MQHKSTHIIYHRWLNVFLTKFLLLFHRLIAIGTGSLVNCFVGSYPGNGSFSRGAINRESGARTPLGSLYSGILVIFALLFLTPYFQYIPNSSLAAVIMAAVIFMVELHVIKPLWRSKSKFSKFFLQFISLEFRFL